MRFSKAGAGKRAWAGEHPVLPGLLPLRLPAARRLWHGPFALVDGASGRRQYPRDSLFVPRTQPVASLRNRCSLVKALRLRAIEKEDLPRFVAWLNDPEVRSNLELSAPFDGAGRTLVPGFWNGTRRRAAAGDRGQQRENWEHVGNFSFIKLNSHDRSAEIGILLGEKIFGTAVSAASHAPAAAPRFNELNLNRIFCGCTKPTRAGCAVMKKPGLSTRGACARRASGRKIY